MKNNIKITNHKIRHPKKPKKNKKKEGGDEFEKDSPITNPFSLDSNIQDESGKKIIFNKV